MYYKIQILVNLVYIKQIISKILKIRKLMLEIGRSFKIY